MRGYRPDHQSDHYAALGVGRSANLAEVRRAFRLLALRHHPDRAGAASTEVFQRIAAAYAILSDPAARAAYDAVFHPRHRPGEAGVRRPAPSAGPAAPHDDEGPGMQSGEAEVAGGRIGWRRARAAAGPLLARLSGALEALLSAGVARRLADGVIELHLHPSETAGGHAAIDAVVVVRCPTCSGLARPRVLWCRRCEYAGTVHDPVTFTLHVPPDPRDGLTFSFATDPYESTPPLRIRLRR